MDVGDASLSVIAAVSVLDDDKVISGSMASGIFSGASDALPAPNSPSDNALNSEISDVSYNLEPVKAQCLSADMSQRKYSPSTFPFGVIATTVSLARN